MWIVLLLGCSESKSEEHLSVRVFGEIVRKFKMPKTMLCAFLLLVLLPWQGTAANETADVWAPLQFMVGNWAGTTHGQPGKGKVERSYQFALKGKFIQVANKSTYPPQASNAKGEIHEDIGFISYDGSRKRFVLRQFHVEGFVNTYVSDVIPEGAHVITFTSEAIENIPAGYRSRETYTILGKDEFSERFEIAEPGKDFALYSENRLQRVGEK
jgi:hypothetical protein